MVLYEEAEIDRDRIIKGLVIHEKNFVLCYEKNRKPLMCFKVCVKETERQRQSQREYKICNQELLC